MLCVQKDFLNLTSMKHLLTDCLVNAEKYSDITAEKYSDEELMSDYFSALTKQSVSKSFIK